MSKPAEKKGAADAAPADAVAKPKSKKLLFIIGGALILGIAGGAGWYFTKKGDHADTAKVEKHVEPPKFVALDPFTVNLQRETADQFLQIGITLKIFQPELEEKIKQNLPEIRSRLLVLLSSKYASELVATNGKKKLVDEIIAETETVLGLRAAKSRPVAPPKPHATPAAEEEHPAAAANADEAPATTEDAAAATEEAAPKKAAPAAPITETAEKVIDVLFTSFIIQ